CGARVGPGMTDHPPRRDRTTEEVLMRTLTAALVALVLVSTTPSPARAQTLRELYSRASPSVVVIRAKGREVSTAGVVRFGECGSAGLGRTAGKVVTPPPGVHGMEDIAVEFRGREPVPARLIGFQPGADLALLQLDTVPSDPPVATLIADSSAMGVGDPVFII